MKVSPELIRQAIRKGLVTKAVLAPAPRADATEAEFSAAVIELARAFGWRCATFRPARVMRGGKETYETPVGADGKGFPDILAVRDRIIAIELKSAKGKLRPDQVRWQQAIVGAGGEWYCWKPADWNQIREVLA